MKLIKNFSINIYELNVILIMIGFQFFSFILTDSFGSIIYRGLALGIACLCLLKTKSSYKKYDGIKPYFLFLLIFILRTCFDLYLGEWSDTQYPAVRTQCLLYCWGIVFIPVLAFYRSFDKIRWIRCLWVLFFLTLIMLMYSIVGISDAKMTVDGRYNMNDKISTITFGDLGGYFLILTCSLWSFDKRKILIPFYAIGVAVAITAIAKAGSRGPLVSSVFALLFYWLRSSSKTKILSIIAALGVVIFAGVAFVNLLEDFAPSLYIRMMNTIVEGDTGNRDILMDIAINKFINSPILGDCWVKLEPREFSSCHNVYMDTFVCLGFFGGLFMVCYMLQLLIKVWKLRKEKLPIEALFIFGLFLFNCMRGLTGIMLVQNTIFSFSIIGVAILVKKHYASNINYRYDKQN